MTATSDLRPTADAPDDDPYLWLEEIDGERALAWVASENARTAAVLAGPALDRDRDLLRDALDRPDRIPHVTRRGGLLYNFWTDAEHKRGLWRRTTLEDYRGGSPAWDLLLDLDALASAENEDWVWHGATTLPPAHDRAILHLSRGGSDAVVLREYDLPGRRFVPDGFELPEAKSDVDWLDRDTLLLSSAHGGPDRQTASGYARTVRLWRRGESPDAAAVLFAVPPDHLAAGAGIDRTAPGGAERIVFVDQESFFTSVMRLGDRAGPGPRLDVPEDARVSFGADHLLVRPRTPWTLDDRTYAPDTVLAFSLSGFLSDRREPRVRRPQVLFEPTSRTAIQSASLVSGRAVLSILDELRPLTRILAPPAPDAAPGTPWTATAIPDLPEAGVVSVYPLDAEEGESDGTLLVNIQDPITPPTLSLSSTAGASPTILRRAPATFDATGLIVSRLEAVAADGERIPYVVTAPAGAPTGDAPVHLSGYGGFAVSSLPYYGTRTGVLWLERGGTAVVANIRGGGEFGTRWHESGRGASKRVSHDDFAVVAADLVRRGITRPERIAAEGGSNGGLLIANMWTRFPDRFGALFCTIPLTDMRRYTKLLAGASWIDEYGNPDSPADWEHLRHISAYHAAAPHPGRTPPILVATTRRDDRVHPGHARKFAAKLRALGAEVLFHEPEAGGHGFGADNEQVAAFAALGARFLRRAIGWDA